MARQKVYMNEIHRKKLTKLDEYTFLVWKDMIRNNKNHKLRYGYVCSNN